jgi:cysteine desulfurase
MQIYLDNNATTQPLPEIQGKWADVCGSFANPSSQHDAGGLVRRQVEKSRQTVSKLINSNALELVFTSGGTESIATVFARQWDVVIVSAVEHTAVLEAAGAAAKKGAQLVSLDVDQNGGLNECELEEVLQKIADEKPKANVLVSLMLANNETGVVFPVSRLAPMIKRYGAVLHVDAVQCVGKIPVDVKDLQCDFLSLSAHKFHGLKGSGVLYVRRGIRVTPLMQGHHENGLRGGTENVPGILALGIAASDAERFATDMKRVETLRNALERGICEKLPQARVNGAAAERLPNTANILFLGKDGAMLVEAFSREGLFVSAGAACSTGGAPSHVLQAMGCSPEEANASIRFSLSKFTTEPEIDRAVEIVCRTVARTMDVFSVNQ